MIKKLIRVWLRLGPSKAELLAEVGLWQRRQHAAELARDQAHDRARHAERLLRSLRHEMRDGLNEPARADGCSKIRFHRKQEAEDWMAAVAAASGEDVEHFNVYDCKTCPRSPVTHARYFHVGHTGTEESEASKAAAKVRRRQEAGAARRQGRTVAQRVDPRVLAQLRKIGTEEGPK